MQMIYLVVGASASRYNFDSTLASYSAMLKIAYQIAVMPIAAVSTNLQDSELIISKFD